MREFVVERTCPNPRIVHGVGGNMGKSFVLCVKIVVNEKGETGGTDRKPGTGHFSPTARKTESVPERTRASRVACGGPGGIGGEVQGVRGGYSPFHPH